MNINRNNYESILIDYLEGTLTPVEVSEVLLFLEQNPDIKSEMEGLMPLEPEAETTAFDYSSLLKPDASFIRPKITPLLVSEVEGNLNVEEKKQLEQAIAAYPELAHDRKLFAFTKNSPDSTIIFPDKSILRKQRVFILSRNWTKVAAALLLAGGLVFGVLKYNPNSPEYAAHQDTQNTSRTAIAANESPIGKKTGINTPSPTNEASPITHQDKESIAKKHFKQTPVNRAISSPMQVAANPNNPVLFNPISVTKPVLPIAPALARVQPNTTPPHLNEEFEELSKLAVRKLKNNTKDVLAGIETYKNLNVVEVINKTTGADVRVDKDTTSGRIQRLEIAALGLAWSRTR